MENKETLKQEVHDFWNEASCGTFAAHSEKYTKAYYEEIEAYRYSKEPEIREFAQFDKWKGKKVLEVGLGAGTDFLQWCRNGALAYGIDLTEEGIAHVQHRLHLYNLSAVEFKVADAESIPYPDNSFDLVYSWGVIHHSPDTEKAYSELVRVCKPGGEIRFMVYHYDSVLTRFFWLKHALLKLKPWKSKAWVLWNHMESIGTKAYTHKSIAAMMKPYKAEVLSITSPFTWYDTMQRHHPLLKIADAITPLFYNKEKNGWFLKMICRKTID
ncbi:MAG: class I SAM-dependent methyltransferase [Bacteroidetes bacterium]|nr:class I SAM-dependent methyltransferase [Bacteroidota bacterium]